VFRSFTTVMTHAIDVADKDGKTERARTGQNWQLFATKEAAEKAAERLNSRGYDAIVTTAELAK
jgi:hypothetical protein